MDWVSASPASVKSVGHEALRIDRQVIGRLVLALAQVPERVLRGQPLQVEADAHAIRRAAPEKANELHVRCSIPLRRLRGCAEHSRAHAVVNQSGE